MSGLPGGYAVFYGGLLVGGDVLAYALAVGHVLGLVLSLGGGGKTEPVIGFDVVLLDAHPDGIKQAQCALGAGVPFVGGLAVPDDGLGHVAADSAAIPIKVAKVNLAHGVALVGGFAVPGCCLRVIGGQLARVAWDAFAGRVGVADLNLRGGIAGGGFGQKSWIDGRGRGDGGLGHGGSQRGAQEEDQDRHAAGESLGEIHGASLVDWFLVTSLLRLRRLGVCW